MVYSILHVIVKEYTLWLLCNIHSGVEAQNAQRDCTNHCRLIFVALISIVLFFIGVATGLLLGKLVFDDETKGPSSANWGGTVTQDGVQKPVLEAIVDMMDANNIEENLK